jgi:AraC family transcriptional regulator of adaptative response/methylated-DNA-[protein]-cysteine methyltransferase
MAGKKRVAAMQRACRDSSETGGFIMMTAENIHETIEIEVWLRTRPRVRYGMISTPFGDAIVSAVNGSLVGLSFCDDSARGLGDLEVRWPSAVFIEDTEMATTFAKGIFRNGRIELPEEGVVLIGTEFQTSVWKHLMGIPSGSVATYSDVARGIGRPDAVRAVATAIGRNPIALLVPCHRIVPLAGGIGQYRWGRERKRNLIAREAMAAT